MGMPPEDPPAGVPDWVLTFGDMMSLLLTFFILLFAMSLNKKEGVAGAGAVDDVLEALLHRFGTTDKLKDFVARRMARDAGDETIKKGMPTNEGQRGRKGSGSHGEGRPGTKSRVEVISEGRRQTIGAPLLFKRGEAVLVPDAEAALQAIANYLRGKHHMIEVKGYIPQGSLPPASRFKDSVDLATARVRVVVDQLVNRGGLRRDLIRIAIGAPTESASAIRSSSGIELIERVDVTTAEATSGDINRSAVPVSDKL